MTDNLTAENSLDFPKLLLKAAEEIRSEGHVGWGNLCALSAEEFERLHVIEKLYHESIDAAYERGDILAQQAARIAELERELLEARTISAGRAAGIFELKTRIAEIEHQNGVLRQIRDAVANEELPQPPPAAPYEAMFTAAVQCLAEISRALDIPDDVASVADGNAEILDAIEVLKCGAPPSGSLLQSFLTVCNRVIEDEHAQGVACGIDFYSLRVGVNRAMAAPRAPETQAAPPSEHQALLSHCVEAVEDLFNREVVERDGYVGYQSLWDRHNRRVVETGELLADLRAAVTQAAPPAAIRELFNKGVGVQAGNRLSMSFETEEEANRAFHYLAELGELETSRPPQTKSALTPAQAAVMQGLSDDPHEVYATCAECDSKAPVMRGFARTCCKAGAEIDRKLGLPPETGAAP